MADVASTLAAWSSTTDSNSPSGATTIGTGLDNNLREIQGVIVRGLSHKGSDIASTTTADVGAVEGLMHDITGSTSISSFGTVRAGILKVLKFEGALTLTHNATSLILPGAANITTADGDVGIFISEGSGNWRCLNYLKASGVSLGPVLATAQASTSGTSIDFTGIPSWAQRITIQFVGVSISGTADFWVQLGDSGGAENTGYSGASSNIVGTVTTVNSTSAFSVFRPGSAASAAHGQLILTRESSSSFTWVLSGVLCDSASAFTTISGGSKSTSAALDRVRITTSNGTDTFDAGAINVLYD